MDSTTIDASDPQTRFPIPNERVLRKSKFSKTPTECSSARKINFQGDGAEVRHAGDLPFQAPRLQWQGQPAMTSRQLQAERAVYLQTQRNRAKTTNENASAASIHEGSTNA